MKPRTAVLLILTLSLALTLTACGEKTPKEPPDLRGQWLQVLSGDSEEEPQYYHLGRITDKSIEIYYYYTADGSTNLYWYGSYTPPEDGKEPYVWVSNNRLPETTSPRIFRYASRDRTKEFTYKKGTLTYMIAPSQALRMNVTLAPLTQEVAIVPDAELPD